MKEKLKIFIEKILMERWPDYVLSEVIEHQYGYGLIFLNKKSGNRFSPTLLPSAIVFNAAVNETQEAKRYLIKELETAFEKELISG